jgi:tRNA U34 2-thiouridine synthase MnmA/TrmU
VVTQRQLFQCQVIQPVLVPHRRLRRRRPQTVAQNKRGFLDRSSRLGLGRLKNPEPKPMVVRYEKNRPGELLHLDTKKLGRIKGIGHRITGDRRGSSHGLGREFLYVCVDDAARVAYAEVLPDEMAVTATGLWSGPTQHSKRHNGCDRHGGPATPPHQSGSQCATQASEGIVDVHESPC